MGKSDRRNGGGQRNLPPQAIEAEQAVLGGLLLSQEAWDKIADRLEETSFYLRQHRLIFRAIQALASNLKPRDYLTVSTWLNDNGLMGDIPDGMNYLIELAAQTPSSANIEAYAKIISDKGVLRDLAETGINITQNAFDPGRREAEEIVAQAEHAVYKIAEGMDKGRREIIDIKTAAADAFRLLQDRADAGGGITGVPTGYRDLDQITAGLQPTDLIILAARPSMGKTALAMGIAQHAAIHAGKAVAVFSMEMSYSQLALRMIASIGKVDAQCLRVGELADEDWAHISNAIAQIKDAKIFIDDTPGLTPEQLRSRAKRLKREHGLGLVVVDYLQLMQSQSRRDNRTAEISEISRSLKALAKEMKVPVLALSQLNRSLEARAEKRPIMADLRESGAIEQDADVIAFIYRDEYYNKESPQRGQAEVIVAKQRNGPTGTVMLRFDGRHVTFSDLQDDPFATPP